jgi:hypothetical protein
MSQFEIWAQLNVSKKSVDEIQYFFRSELKIPIDYLMSNMHLTVYHSRRPLPDLKLLRESCSYTLDTNETRFMVQAPGGENPRKNLIPGLRKVGIRVQRSSPFFDNILAYRSFFYPLESSVKMGGRSRSNNRRNAFGARHFQPHITVLKGGSGIQTDLTEVGISFRDAVPEIHFDNYTIEVNRKF